MVLYTHNGALVRQIFRLLRYKFGPMAFAFLMRTTEAKIPEFKDATESFKG